MLDVIAQQNPVRESRQRIVQRLMAELVFELPAFGDIASRHHDRSHVGVSQEINQDGFDVAKAAVGMTHSELSSASLAGIGQYVPEGGLPNRLVIIMDELIQPTLTRPRDCMPELRFP